MENERERGRRKYTYKVGMDGEGEVLVYRKGKSQETQRGILDLVKGRWETGKDMAQLTIQQILEIREHQDRVVNLAKGKLMNTQAKQKECYDKRVKVRLKTIYRRDDKAIRDNMNG